MYERDKKLAAALQVYEDAIGMEETFSLADGRALVKMAEHIRIAADSVSLHLAIPAFAAALAGLIDRYSRVN